MPYESLPSEKVRMMRRKLARFLNRAAPVDPLILLYSVFLGALSGAVLGIIHRDPEYASGIAIAICIQVGVGMWLSLKLSLAVDKMFQNSLGNLMDRLSQVKELLGADWSSAEASQRPKSIVVELFFMLIWPIKIGVIGGSILGIAALTQLVTGLSLLPVQIWSLPIIFFAIAVVGLVYQLLYLKWFYRKLAELEAWIADLSREQLAALLGEAYDRRYTKNAQSFTSMVSRAESAKLAA